MDNFLAPILALILWSLIIWVIMVSRFIPHLLINKVDPQSTRSPSGEWRKNLPERVLFSIDNYNHLFEQPTIFYALMVFLQITGGTEAWVSVLAWLYVGLRVIHSVNQISVNHVIARFAVFFLSTIVLIALSMRGLILMFQS